MASGRVGYWRKRASGERLNNDGFCQRTWRAGADLTHATNDFAGEKKLV